MNIQLLLQAFERQGSPWDSIKYARQDDLERLAEWEQLDPPQSNARSRFFFWRELRRLGDS